jgi:hypothetical protein
VLAGIFSFLSVEYVTSGISATLLQAMIPGMSSSLVTVEAGIRLTGIFATPNPTATLLAFAMFFTIYLICTEGEEKRRLFYAGLLALEGYTFLMLFSMAGTALFGLSLLVYLAVAGKGQRSAAFLRMLEGAVPTVVWVFVGFPFLTAEGALKLLPLLAMVGNVVTVSLLEKLVTPKLTGTLEQHGKAAAAVIVGLLALMVVYLAVAANLSNAYTLGEEFRRSVYLSAGEHTLTVEATGPVELSITSQNQAETVMHTYTYLYDGNDSTVTFTVPEGSKVCYINFSGENVTIQRATVDGSKNVKLHYPLLPAFIANRLQGLLANQNAIQRTAFWEDGIKLFLQRPLLGNGVGSFETALSSVQSFYYETKYIHNHYIQVLEECGVVGFVPFVGALIAMVVLLWKKRKEERWEFREMYAPLWAAMVMLLTHISFELSLSNAVFLFYAYATFGVIIRCCTAPAVEEAPDAPKWAKKKGKAVVEEKASPFRWGLVIWPVVFGATIVGNLAAYQITRAAADSESTFMRNLTKGASMDLYENNDAKLSYVLASLELDRLLYGRQADIYAGELLQVHSNSIPVQLTRYYLATDQPELAIQAAKMSATYSASSHDAWNETIAALGDTLLGEDSPLYEDPALVDALLEYYSMLQQRNETSMEEIQLTLDSMDFWDKVLTIEAGDTVADALENQVFSSRSACDANGDGIPDQVSAREGATFSQGAIQLEAGGNLDVALAVGETSGMVRVTVTCEDPGAVAASITSRDTTFEGQVTGDRVSFDMPTLSARDGELSLHLSSAVAQTVDSVEVRWAGK